MATRLLCLVNPRSGGYRGESIAELLRSVTGPDVEIEVARLERGSPLPFRAEMEDRFTDVLIAGGDGTFSSILPDFAGSPLCFHLLALGTGNDLPRELGVARMWRGSARDFVAESLALHSVPLTVWEADLEGDRKISFVNYLSFGWDGAVVGRFDAYREANHFLSGKFAPWGNRALYGYSALREPRIPLPTVTACGAEGERSFRSGYCSLIVANIGSIMGVARLSRLRGFGDETLEVAGMRTMSQYVELILTYSLRRQALADDTFSATDLVLEFAESSGPVPIQVDGEAVPPFRGRVVRFRPLGQVHVKAREV